jgi:hypothetical protein
MNNKTERYDFGNYQIGELCPDYQNLEIGTSKQYVTRPEARRYWPDI